jgi:hypothetical protein
MARSEFLATPTWNPLEVMTDARVAAASAGTLTAYIKRKWAFKSFRNVFGWAALDAQGNLVYYGVKDDGTVDTNVTVGGAFGNRLLFNLSDVVAGSLIIGQVQDPNADYFGLGLAVGGATNFVMTLFGID